MQACLHRKLRPCRLLGPACVAQLRHVGWAEVVCTNASKAKRVGQVLGAVVAAGEQHRRRVNTATLNLVLKEATAWKAPPTQRVGGRKGRIYYATQVGWCCFLLFMITNAWPCGLVVLKNTGWVA